MQVNATRTEGYLFMVSMAMVMDFTGSSGTAGSWLGSLDALAGNVVEVHKAAHSDD